MPKPKNATGVPVNVRKIKSADNKAEDNSGIAIKVSKSSIAEFTRRNVPTAGEVDKFDELIGGRAYADEPVTPADEEREEEIIESLNEIYQDDKGGLVNVKELDARKKHGFLYWLFVPLLLIGGLAASAYAAYQYLYLQPGSDATAIEFSISGDTEVTAGEEFFYTIAYRNQSNIPFRNARIDVNLPADFILVDTLPEKTDEESAWILDSIPARYSGTIRIKGKIIATPDKTSFISAAITYVPENFSSEFRKEATLTTSVRDIGLDIDFDHISSVLVAEDNELIIRLRKKEQGYIDNFRVSVEPQENLSLEKAVKLADDVQAADYTMLRPGVFEVRNLTTEEQILPVGFNFKEKLSDSQDIKLVFEYLDEGMQTGSSTGRYLTFHTEALKFEVMKSDLNLTLIVNGSKEDQGIDFGQTLNYTIAFKNKGETEMKDVVIMAVLESDFIVSDSVNDPNSGTKRGNTLSWSKEEISKLEALGQNEEGMIDFSVKVADREEIDPQKKYEVKSYAQYSVGNKDEFKGESDNRSNTIINRINSDLELMEQARYFSEDNIPVGTGPHPPRVGETTSYKIYWQLSNTLHELAGLQVSVVLPEYVTWDGRNRASAGTVTFDESARRVTWNIGRLPVTVTEATAEWSIAITPTEADRNKIMVLLPGSSVTAVDSETKAELSATSKAETTRLDDDDIAQGDGTVK